MMVDVKPAGDSWYKRAIIDQVHVRTFFDSNRDGAGDFQGLDQKMDYLQELGINAVWLMPLSTDVSGCGSIEFLYPANHRILAYLRQLRAETILAVNNLSNAAQAVELDLRRCKGNILIEMFGKNIFPRVGKHRIC
jgi:glycosidase